MASVFKFDVSLINTTGLTVIPFIMPLAPINLQVNPVNDDEIHWHWAALTPMTGVNYFVAKTNGSNPKNAK